MIWLYGLIIFVLSHLLYISDAIADDIAKEYKVKAAFSINFAKFTKWPESAFSNSSSPYIFYVIGNKSVVSAFQSISGQKVGTRTFNLKYGEIPSDLDTCHMIFISRTVKTSEVLQILKKVKGKTIVTISETEEFIQQGGMINFFTKKERLYFEINMGILEQQNIWFSSRLLNLAVLTGKQ